MTSWSFVARRALHRVWLASVAIIWFVALLHLVGAIGAFGCAQDLVTRGGAAAGAAGLQLAPAALSPAALRLERGRAWLVAHPSG